MEIQIGEQRRGHASYNIAKRPLEFSTTLPRERLRASYGQGFRGAPLQSDTGSVRPSKVRPPSTSLTGSVCGWAEKRQRHKGRLRCWRCSYPQNANFTAARKSGRRAQGYCHSHSGSLSLVPRGAQTRELQACGSRVFLRCQGRTQPLQR